MSALTEQTSFSKEDSSLDGSIKVVYRKSKSKNKNALSFFGEISLPKHKKKVSINGRTIDLTRKEYELAHHFLIKLSSVD